MLDFVTGFYQLCNERLICFFYFVLPSKFFHNGRTNWTWFWTNLCNVLYSRYNAKLCVFGYFAFCGKKFLAFIVCCHFGVYLYTTLVAYLWENFFVIKRKIRYPWNLQPSKILISCSVCMCIHVHVCVHTHLL